MMRKTRKCLEICENGFRFVCIFDSTVSTNNYRLYQESYDFYGKRHRRLIEKYANFESVIAWLNEFAIRTGIWSKDYFKEGGN